MNGKFCGEAWDAISRYVYTALQGGSIMHKWTNDDRMMITCCNDGTRPVIFKIERIDIPENEEEEQWLAKQNFKNTAEDAYTGWPFRFCESDSRCRRFLCRRKKLSKGIFRRGLLKTLSRWEAFFPMTLYTASATDPNIVAYPKS